MPGRSASKRSSCVVSGYRHNRHAFADFSFCASPARTKRPTLFTTPALLRLYCNARWGRVPKGFLLTFPEMALTDADDVRVSLDSLLELMQRPTTEEALHALALELSQLKSTLGHDATKGYAITYTASNGTVYTY